MLWFDVEIRYNTTPEEVEFDKKKLWFDVEIRYNTTYFGKFAFVL